MTREEKILISINKGYTCNPYTGDVFGIRKKLSNIHTNGYIEISFYHNKKNYNIKAHQFIYYWVYKKCVEQIDHINGKRCDNRIENLRSVTNQQNQFNRNCKGYSYRKANKINPYQVEIMANGKSINLGCFSTKEEASKAYQDAKKIHHQI